MPELIKNYMDRIQIGAEQSYKNLAVFPVLSDYVIPFDYLTLDEALKKDLIEVVEIDKGGSVPELKVINKSDKMVLIPVSCVEEGRWSYDTERFHSEERMMAPMMRAAKARQVNFSLRQSGDFRSDQGAIWNQISAKASRRKAESDSMAMAEIYKKDQSNIHDYLQNFTIIDSQIGAIFLINGKVVGMDCFGKPETFEKTFKKIIESYALDAIDWFDSKAESKTSKAKVRNFVKTANEAQVETHPSVGLGTDCRLDSKKCTGFALAHEDQVVHLSVFARESGGKKTKPFSRMQRFSGRRRTRM
ncbi:MAG: ARPP-1 family domain-containing protein [Planctomycetota bacterium]|jgi:hypothetical protein